MNFQQENKPIPMTFAGGPTYMPSYLKQSLQQKMFSQRSYLEVNSNTKEFSQIVTKARQNMRRILNIPNDSQIWFIGGGCHLQFAGIPLNYVGNNEKNTVANYTTTGYFSKLSFSEAQRYCTPKSIMDLKKNNDGQFYLEDNYNFDAKAVYTHFIDNESVEGIEYPDSFFPVVEGIPLIDDCSSSFLTKYIDWNKVDMAYAHAQKNCGISGLTVMIVNNKTLKTNPNKILPEICSFQNYSKLNGYYAEMNILPIYTNYIVTKNVEANGGVNANNYIKRSERLYEVLQKYKIYKPKVKRGVRSRITVTWDIQTQQLLTQVLAEGAKENLYEFKGHRSTGGLRASLFCPIPDQSVYRLADFLQDFGKKFE